MPAAVLPENEEERLALIEELDILYSAKEEDYDNLAYIASAICQTPIALISIVDQKQQWFKSNLGIESEEMKIELAFCAHAILDDKIMYVPDAAHDPRFSDNPIVHGPPKVRFYAGYPLEVKDDLRVGTLCVIDNKPNSLTEEQLKCLKMLGKQVESLLRLRLALRQLEQMRTKDLGIMNMLNHELRNPLTSIIGYLSIIESGGLEELPERVNACSRNATRMLGLVNDFLLFSELDQKSLMLKKQLGEVNRCILDSVKLMGGLLETRGLKIEFALDERVPKIAFDYTRILQVVDNLISNACKYAKEGGRILISSSFDDQWVKIEVKDFGPGIPSKNQKRIFEPFSKGAKPGASSSGLGLSIAKQIVTLHQGKIGFTSQEGEGTTFYFSLPRE